MDYTQNEMSALRRAAEICIEEFGMQVADECTDYLSQLSEYAKTPGGKEIIEGVLQAFNRRDVSGLN